MNKLFRIESVICYVLLWSGPGLSEEMPLLVTDDFEQGMDRWEPTDSELPETVWKIDHDGDGDQNHVLRVTGASKYQPPHRSPHSIAWLKNTVVGDFEITVKVKNTRPEAGNHRDLCLFWGKQDAAHFYYVHLGAKPDPHSCQIFIVDGAPRKMITKNKTTGTKWQDGWHTVKVVRRVKTGDMHVYFDDMDEPFMVANDSSFLYGQVGLGTFDDHGNFDDFELRGEIVKSPPAVGD